jgi:hypothetical protein
MKVMCCRIPEMESILKSTMLEPHDSSTSSFVNSVYFCTYLLLRSFMSLCVSDCCASIVW